MWSAWESVQQLGARLQPAASSVSPGPRLAAPAAVRAGTTLEVRFRVPEEAAPSRFWVGVYGERAVEALVSCLPVRRLEGREGVLRYATHELAVGGRYRFCVCEGEVWPTTHHAVAVDILPDPLARRLQSIEVPLLHEMDRTAPPAPSRTSAVFGDSDSDEKEEEHGIGGHGEHVSAPSEPVHALVKDKSRSHLSQAASVPDPALG